MRAYLSLVAVVMLAASAPAQADRDWIAGRLNVPAEQWLDPDQIAAKLADKGYRVQKIESDDGAYEVEMTNKDGVRIEAHVHPATGELLRGYDD